MVEPQRARPVFSRACAHAAPAHEVKFTSLDLKAVDGDGTFEGYASVFHREDLSRDMVLPGAFADSLRSRGPGGVKMLYQHDANQPIGVWAELKEDSRGLYALGRLMPEVARAREVHALMRAGALDGLSIGFRTVKGRRDRAAACAASRRSISGRFRSSPFRCCPRRASPTLKTRPFAGSHDAGFRTLAHAGRWADAQGGARASERGLRWPQGPAGRGPGHERGIERGWPALHRRMRDAARVPQKQRSRTGSKPNVRDWKRRSPASHVGAAFDDFMRAFEALQGDQRRAPRRARAARPPPIR